MLLYSLQFTVAAYAIYYLAVVLAFWRISKVWNLDASVREFAWWFAVWPIALIGNFIRW